MTYRVFVMLMMLLAGCTGPKENAIGWIKSARLPDVGGKDNLGVAGPMVGVFGDSLIIAGGANFPEGMPWEGGKKIFQNQVYLYSIDGEGLRFQKQFDLDRGIGYSANFDFEHKLYSAGGEDENGALSQVSCYSLSPSAGLQKTKLPDLPVPLSNGGLSGNKDHLYFIGGENSEFVSDKIYGLDLNDEPSGWKEIMNLPYPISHAVVVGDLGEKIYVLGGRKRNLNSRSDIYDSVLEIHVGEDRSIRAITKLPRTVAAGTGIYHQGRIFVFGGDDGSTFHQVEDALGAIQLESDSSKREKLIEAKNKLQVNHPGFSRENWVYDISTGSWFKGEDMRGISPVTTTAIMKDQLIIIPSGEVRAGVRTNEILVGRLRGDENKPSRVEKN